MDVSKLPKLSQTEPPPNEPPAEPSTTPSRSADQRADVGARHGQEPISLAEVWISIAVGAILLLMFPTMLKYVCSRLFGTTFPPFRMPDGTEVPYPKVYPQFWSDLCVTLFALVLILEGLTLALVRRRALVRVAFGVTVLATATNLWFVIATFATYGPPIVSMLAVAFGGYIAMYQWRMSKMLPR